MDLSKAFDTVNRDLLWTALYRKGIPLDLILATRKSHENTRLKVKLNGELGPNVTNNCGVFQGSPLSALLFIIYLDDMMDDVNALNDNCKLHPRVATARSDTLIQKQTLTDLDFLNNLVAGNTDDEQEASEDGHRDANPGDTIPETVVSNPPANHEQVILQPPPHPMRALELGLAHEDEQTQDHPPPLLGPVHADGQYVPPPQPQVSAANDPAQGEVGDHGDAGAGPVSRAPRREDTVIYADDTNFLIHDDTITQINRRLQNYIIAAKPRLLGIQWEKTEALTAKHSEKNRQIFDPPINTIKCTDRGKALGRVIHINAKCTEAIRHRLTLAKHCWFVIKNTIFRKNKIQQHIRLNIWNAIVRSTLTYSLTISENTENAYESLEKFTYTCLKFILHPGKVLKTNEHHISRRKLYLTLHQPTTKSWITTLKTKHAMRQYDPHTGIHGTEEQRFKTTMNQWREHWKNLAAEVNHYAAQFLDLGANNQADRKSLKHFNPNHIIHNLDRDPGQITQYKILHNQLWPKKKCDAIRLFLELTHNPDPPNVGNSDHTEKHRWAQIMLTYPTDKTHSGEHAQNTLKCPTCTKNFAKIGNLNNHRSRDPRCRTRWLREKNAIQFCNNDNCEEFFKNNKELNKHIKYHCTHQHKEHRTITNGIYDRRKLNNAGDPNEDELLHGGGVHYSPAATSPQVTTTPTPFEYTGSNT